MCGGCRSWRPPRTVHFVGDVLSTGVVDANHSVCALDWSCSVQTQPKDRHQPLICLVSCPPHWELAVAFGSKYRDKVRRTLVMRLRSPSSMS
ncbi:hypothetical protein BAUCODRAFT_36154 [Baudoinia panamericana UAMH 10762]|uniref:Uncharacterized protein n=1 Tax=Baudoinia panamericana (strain UAMH 10762) TaxID=717646 RepID=M2LKS1_BAUPA|nr:uncharacterized protein BAUCODRAFT_36154 [Baudoinia panamericana UAMH 10762]EMC94882.1 hypothetical protein BAUCODRAFT_36154 [Baudoinia panamericana UAMH 10762]